MLHISIADQNKLFQQSQSKTLQDNSYLTNSNNENFQYIKQKFFNWEEESVAKLLNVGSGLFSTISDTISYYVGKPQIELEIDIRKYVDDYIALWFATIWLTRTGGKLETEYQPAKNYWNDNWIDKILRLYTKEDENTMDLYMLVTTYTVWLIENNLYKLEGTTYTSTEEVELATLPQTEWLLPKIDTWLDIPALIVIQDDELEQYPMSMLEKIKALVYSVDRTTVMQHVQFLQNVESFVLFKWIRRPQKLLTQYDNGKKIDFSSVGRVINWEEWSSIEFVNNTNDLITQSIEENENNIRRIWAITDIPVEFIGLETKDGAIGAGSRTLKQWSFMKRIQWIRNLFDKYIKIILEAGKYDTEITRPDILAKSDTELVEELKVARESKIISQFEAIKRYNRRDDNQAQEELDRINKETEENIKALSVNTDNNEDNKGDNNPANKWDSKNSKTKDKFSAKK